MRNKHLKLILFFALFVISTVAIDRLFIQGVVRFNRTDEPESKANIYTYTFYPFHEFSGSVPMLPSKEGWRVSHPIGLGDYEKIISIKIPGLEKDADVKCQTFLDFSNGYKERLVWEKMTYDSGLYYVKPVRKSPFLQIAVRRADRKKLVPDAITVTVEMKTPIGFLNIANRATYNAMNAINETAMDSSEFLFSPVFLEKPLRTVKLDETFSTYRLINILNGLNCNVIGEIDFKNLESAEIQRCVNLYKDSIKVWKLSGTQNLTREYAETIISFIFNTSSSSLIIWENQGILPNAFNEAEVKDWSPVKLNRGTLWTGVIFLSLLFLIAGTIRIFGIGLHIDAHIIQRNLSFIPPLALVFLLPLLAEGINFLPGLNLFKTIIVGATGVFIAEFIRCLLLKSGEFILRKSKLKKLNESISGHSSEIMIFLSSLLVAFLSAGYPGFSFNGSALLVISNVITGLFLGNWFIKHKSLTLNFVIHLISATPFIILIGKF